VTRRKRTAPPPPCIIISTLLAWYASLVARIGPRSEPVARRVALLAVGVYRHTITRWTTPCPQKISCSTFALQVIRECGPVIGVELAAYRIANCRPPRAENLPPSRHPAAGKTSDDPRRP